MSCNCKNDTILHAATKHFATSGFDGARMDEIADEAGVNKATLYYRIGNKEALYERIFVELIGGVLIEIEKKIQEKSDPEDQLLMFSNVFAQSLQDNIYISPLILREVASGGTHLNNQALEKMHQFRAVLTKILEKGEANGAFQPSNPFLIHMLLVGTLNFYSASASIRNKISTTTNNNENFILPVTDIAAEVANLVLNSIRIKKTML